MPALWDERHQRLADGTILVARFTNRLLGDLHVDAAPDQLEVRRRRVCAQQWSVGRQVHGTALVTVDRPGAGSGVEADGFVSEAIDAPCAVNVADCAPVLIWNDDSRFAVVHAGWRGLQAGILARAAEHLRSEGAEVIGAMFGPCIDPGHYAFGPDLLGELAAAFGPTVRAETNDGAPALDLAAAVTAALGQVGVTAVERVGGSTADASRYFSHRVRGESGRQALVAWKERR